MKKLIVYLL